MTPSEIEEFEAQLFADLEDAWTHGLFVEEIDPVYQSPYYSFLLDKEEQLGLSYENLYGQWLCDEELKASRRSTGA